MKKEIESLIPQRDPFLFVDEIIDFNQETIIVKKTFTPDEYFFEGHFPHNPIVPGVILCEMCFQAGALYMSKTRGKTSENLAVVSRIQNAKFKNIVKPNDVLETQVSLTEQLENAFYMKAKVVSNKKTVLTMNFACTLVS